MSTTAGEIADGASAHRTGPVLVGLAGVGGDELVRRAAAIAAARSERLIGVHVVRGDEPPGRELEIQRALVRRLGGHYREVVATDAALGIAAIARDEGAADVVLGIGRETGRTRRHLAVTLLRQLEGTDLHIVATDAFTVRLPPLGVDAVRPRPSRPPRPALAWVTCLGGLPLLTVVLVLLRDHVAVGASLLLDLCVVTAVAALGGRRPGLVAAFLAFGLTNWFLTPPYHTLAVNESEDVVALTVFVLVTMVVSIVVDRWGQRTREALVARAEAGALARSAATLVGVDDPLPELLDHLRTTFGVAWAAVIERDPSGEVVAHESGAHAPSTAPITVVDLAVEGGARLEVAVASIAPEQLETLRAFADQLAVAIRSRRLHIAAQRAEVVAQADALRAALLQAVSHDLRTPLATIIASASGLLEPDALFGEGDRTQLAREIVTAADRLEQMVHDLLDLSRLQAGAVVLSMSAVPLEEVVATAVAALPSTAVDVRVDPTLPLVDADRGLLERALANVVSNAAGWSPAAAPVVVDAAVAGGTVRIAVVDHGPGVAPADRDRIFVPFQRLGDRSHEAGAGLGLAIARGFVEAMGGRITAEDTPGGGLTMVIELPTASPGTGTT